MPSPEHTLIQTFLTHAPAGVGVRIGPGDDAAVLANGDAITIDTLVQGVHFDHRLSFEDVGFKAVAVSVSDLCAMGARPEWMVLSVSVPIDAADSDVEALARGVGEAATQFGCGLVGGDTTRGPWVVSITMGGKAPAHPWRRSGARPGDGLFVTGWLGLAGAGYSLDHPDETCLAALRRPSPPLAFALDAVHLKGIHAAMDLSDGLAADLPRLCAASGVGATVGSIPLHPSLREHPELPLTGGEDYQLLLAVAPGAQGPLSLLAAEHQVRFDEVGTVTDTGEIHREGGWPRPAFQHFEPAA